MYSSIICNNGTIRCFWKDIRDDVEKINPELASIIDELSPDSSFPLYMMNLPYGMLKGDTKSSYYPDTNNIACRLDSPDLPSAMKSELGYGISTSPLGFVLSNTLEYFIEYNNKTIPFDIVTPGKMFNKGVIFSSTSKRNYSPKGVLKASSGLRNAFVLPSINHYDSYLKLRSEIGVKVNRPQDISQHGEIFKEICRAVTINSDWRTKLIYFTDKWISHIKNDLAWGKLYRYITEEDREEGIFFRNQSLYEFFYSITHNKNNLKTTSPYLTETIRHLFKIMLGEMPGYAPIDNELFLPISDIQSCFYNIFNIKYHPTIIGSSKLGQSCEDKHVYYSMQQPTLIDCSLKRNNKVTALSELASIEHMLSYYIEAMKDSTGILRDTVFNEISKYIHYSFYHNSPSSKDIDFINHSSLLTDADPRFVFNNTKYATKKFNHEANFLRGCIRFSKTKLLKSKEGCLNTPSD